MEARTRRTRAVSDMEIDEISLVDRPANQHAVVTLAKRANEEDAVPEEFFDQSGDEVDLAELEDGDIVYDADGNAFQFNANGDDNDDDGAAENTEPEPQTVGKATPRRQPRTAERSPFGKRAPAEKREPVAKSFADQVREQLSKALTDADRDEVLAKALGQMDEYEQRAAQAEQIAKSERDLRLTREYIAKAAEYNVPVDPEELGPVLMRCAENLDFDDCAVLHKALTAAGEMLFEEAGYTGQNDNVDPFDQVEAYLDEQAAKQVAKGAERISKEHAITEFFDNDPSAYDRYRAETSH